MEVESMEHAESFNTTFTSLFIKVLVTNLYDTVSDI